MTYQKAQTKKPCPKCKKADIRIHALHNMFMIKCNSCYPAPRTKWLRHKSDACEFWDSGKLLNWDADDNG